MAMISKFPEKFVPYRSRTGTQELKKQLYFSFYSRLSDFIVSKRKKQGSGYFTFRNKEFSYLIHSYNLAWNNERTVEVPIVIDFLKSNRSKNNKILEFGSVLRHYTKPDWVILDKFEKYPGVINKDVIDLEEQNKYDLIISISTLEHVGLDDVNNPEKILKAIKVLQAALKPGGQAMITIPIGYNIFLDKKIFASALEFSSVYFLKRRDKNNHWQQVTADEIKDCQYDHPFYCANAIAICYYKKSNP